MRFCKSIVAAATLVFAAGTAWAGDSDVIKYRQNNMQIIGGHMGSIAAIVKGEVDHKDQLAAHAKGMAEVAALVKAVFKEEVTGGKTSAKPEIWSDWQKFEKDADNFQAAANELATAAAEGN